MPWFWQQKPPATTTASTSPSEARSQTSTTNALALPTLASTAILTATLLALSTLYRRRLRRIPTVAHLPPRTLHASIDTHPHTLFGRVTSVGDGDGLRFYHTPGGRLLLWHVVRRIPAAPTRATLSVRLSGIDAPEGAHFGRAAQPFAADAHAYLRAALQGRDVRLYAHSRDQYGRVVATVLARPWRGLGVGLPARWQRDVGAELLARGLATVYEAKSGVEHGGARRREQLRRVQERARARRVGMWGLGRGGAGGAARSDERGWARRVLGRVFRGRGAAEGEGETLETPREYKTRVAREEQQQQQQQQKHDGHR